MKLNPALAQMLEKHKADEKMRQEDAIKNFTKEDNPTTDETTFKYRGHTVTIYDENGDGRFNPDKDWVRVVEPGVFPSTTFERSSEDRSENNREANESLRRQHIHLFKFFSNKPLDRIADYYNAKQNAEDYAQAGDMKSTDEWRRKTRSAAREAGLSISPSLNGWSLYLDQLKPQMDDLTTGALDYFFWS